MKKIILLTCLLAACSTPTPGADKTVGGAVLGAAWGAGAGAVVGHQFDGTFVPQTGEGAAIGAGFGLVSGAMQGAGYDVAEDQLIKQQNELDALRVVNLANAQELTRVQSDLDNMPPGDLAAQIYQVNFDVDETSLKSGSAANLEKIADAIKSSSRVGRVVVSGHSDDSGDEEYNDSLAMARARSVTNYLTGRGINSGLIDTKSFGSKRPLASNSTPSGRHLNRRAEITVEIN
jgi:outer membrane protein OmpA-like peptidoglycan-associated protein